jgi:hypothetical protein
MGIGLVPLQRRGGPGMPRVQADHGQAELLQRVVQPGRERAGLQPNALEVGGMAPKRCGQGFRLARALATPDRLARPVHHVDRGLLVRHVEPSIVRHGDLPGLPQPAYPAVPRPSTAPIWIATISLVSRRLVAQTQTQ